MTDMGRLRQRAMWIVCGWLCCQLSLLTAVPLSLAAGLPHAADSISCTCVHGANAQCPMHHPANPTPNCHCRNAADPDAAAIVSLLGTIAVLADTPARSMTLSMTRLPNSSITGFVSVLTPPDGPPPRA
jgi:hypothetical protein